MYLTFDIRATSILYSFLQKNKGNGIWIIPVNVCHLVPACFIKAKCPFEIVDVDKLKLDLDENQVIQKLIEYPRKYSGILSVRNYGGDYSKESFFKKIRKHEPDIKIIDDACLSYPDINTPLSSLVDLELYSTGYSKPLDLGFGGFGKLHTQENQMKPMNLNFEKESLKKMNNYYVYLTKKFMKAEHNRFKTSWLNSENINSSEYLNQISSNFEKTKKHKNKINKIYDNLLKLNLKERRLSTNWRYNIKLLNPDLVLDKIFENGLFASQHYFPLNRVFDSNLCPNWENAYKSILNLFNDKRFSTEQAEKCCEIVNKYAKAINN